MQTSVATNPIYVTMPTLPPMEEYTALLEGVWKRGILTHNGPLVQQLERELEAKLNLKHMVSVVNGTVAIQLAMKALDIEAGEIITTPFTWVATASALLWERCTPVFVDIDPETLNIDPNKIEAAISHRTRAILPVHVFSNPCDIEAIDTIAKKHNLKVIYDGAHALYVNYKGKSLLEYGDISTTSFHATKLFQTGEGGGCATGDDELYERLKRIRFFGHNDAKDIVEDGTNGKMTEIHAALGIANLKYIDDVLAKRKQIYHGYRELLASAEDRLRYQKFSPDSYNYSYMPAIFQSEEVLLRVEKALNAQNIFPRRYFYPSINTMRAVAAYQACPLSEDVSSRILSLPSYTALSMDDVARISDIILKNL